MMNFLRTTTALLLLALGSTAWAHSVSPQKLVRDARSQIGQTVSYDPAYRTLAYPMGDVPLSTGVCTDVIVRALRHQGLDLQQQMHEDMKAHFSAYPKQWGLKRPDRNIDHRRVPNIATYFTRQGYRLSNGAYQSGDIVTWALADGRPHIGIVSDRKSRKGHPLIIHNIGSGTREEDVLYQYRITGHFRLPAK